ncbi:hypothetical protein H206_05172 [Candidatus Electrothrix aarhusensis]|uniref:Uncharacterized protein n=1 Tax=Candidatus Electrothrix aarhusensis TaxID=1859131 RepID=A0A444J5G0_9BACT|nr:hypothetical protein H206_05172 [Candidatus Electrothrix aarhusensis]
MKTVCKKLHCFIRHFFSFIGVTILIHYTLPVSFSDP